jgi:hypothetical protein
VISDRDAQLTSLVCLSIRVVEELLQEACPDRGDLGFVPIVCGNRLMGLLEFLEALETGLNT